LFSANFVLRLLESTFDIKLVIYEGGRLSGTAQSIYLGYYLHVMRNTKVHSSWCRLVRIAGKWREIFRDLLVRLKPYVSPDVVIDCPPSTLFLSIYIRLNSLVLYTFSTTCRFSTLDFNNITPTTSSFGPFLYEAAPVTQASH